MFAAVGQDLRSELFAGRLATDLGLLTIGAAPTGIAIPDCQRHGRVCLR